MTEEYHNSTIYSFHLNSIRCDKSNKFDEFELSIINNLFDDIFNRYKIEWKFSYSLSGPNILIYDQVSPLDVLVENGFKIIIVKKDDDYYDVLISYYLPLDIDHDENMIIDKWVYICDQLDSVIITIQKKFQKLYIK